MKKGISLFIAFVLIMLTIVPAMSVFAAGDACNCAYTPIIYVKGRTNIYKNVNNLDEGIAEPDGGDGMSEDAIKDAAFNISTAFGLAMLTDKWDNYCDVMFEELSPLYDQYALNEDGEIDNESGILPNWNIENIVSRVYSYGRDFHINSRNDITQYQFQYDCRIDPCETAADLNRLVKAVIDVSGHSKVKIIARCQGTVIANAYFNIFGWDDVEDVLIYNSIANGAEIADSVFSGNVVFESSAWNRFLYEFLDTTPVLDLIKAVVEVSAYNGLLGSVTGLVQTVYNKIESNLMPRIIKATFGQCPGWYGMISPDKIDDCKSFLLGDNADEKYDKLIEKIDFYNDNYKCNARNVLEDMQADGVDVYIVAKYNEQMYPVVEDNSQMGDGVVSTWKQTYEGATCSNVTLTLSDEYIASANPKYISPDKIVDASTGLFPDHTWYIRDLPHDYYPLVFDAYMFRILRYDGYTTVDTFEDIPQWLQFVGTTDDDNNHLEILSEENSSTSENWPETSFYEVLINFIKKLFAFFTYEIQKLRTTDAEAAA